MTDLNLELEALVSPLQSVQACLVIDTRVGELHLAYVRGTMSLEPEEAARRLAAANRSQADAFSGQDALRCTIERASEIVVLEPASPLGLVALFFEGGTPLGLVRMHVARVVSELGDLLPRRDVVVPPSGAPEPALTSRSAEGTASRSGRKLLDYLGAHAPDTHAALLRVSLQTGLPLSRLESPDELTSQEFEQVAQSVQRILGLETLTL